MPLSRYSAKTRYRLDVAWRIAFTVLTLWVLHEARQLNAQAKELAQQTAVLAQENRARITEIRGNQKQIQEDRVSSCQRTYEGVREIFMPFLTPSTQRTPEQQERIDLFNQTIDERKAACAKQTGVADEQGG